MLLGLLPASGDSAKSLVCICLAWLRLSDAVADNDLLSLEVMEATLIGKSAAKSVIRSIGKYMKLSPSFFCKEYQNLNVTDIAGKTDSAGN